MEEQLAIEVEQLHVSYGEGFVLTDLTFTLPKGKLSAVVGPNGAGKSTLLKALIGLEKPLTGKVQFSVPSSRVAYVPQRNLIDWDFPISVFDVVLMGRYISKGLFGFLRKKDKEKAKQALIKVGLEEFADRQISELSGGQQQRVFIARALAEEAEIYLMDEPFAAIDAATEKSLFAILRSLCDEGKTVVVVHHNLSAAKEQFDHVLLLANRLVSCAEAKEALCSANIDKAYGMRHGLCSE